MTLYPSLKGRVVFISGGSSGIGAELVRVFAAQGSSVAFCGTREGGGDALIAECTAAGHPAPWYAACDVRDVAGLPGRAGPRRGAISGRSACWSTTPAATTATRWKRSRPTSGTTGWR